MLIVIIIIKILIIIVVGMVWQIRFFFCCTFFIHIHRAIIHNGHKSLHAPISCPRLSCTDIIFNIIYRQVPAGSELRAGSKCAMRNNDFYISNQTHTTHTRPVLTLIRVYYYTGVKLWQNAQNPFQNDSFEYRFPVIDTTPLSIEQF